MVQYADTPRTIAFIRRSRSGHLNLIAAAPPWSKRGQADVAKLVTQGT